MGLYPRVAALIVAVSLLPFPAWGESLVRIADAHTGKDESGNPVTSTLRGIASLGRGKLFVDPLGPVNYRFSRDYLKAKFDYGGTSMVARIGYDGEHRLEFSWRSFEGGNMRFALKSEEGNRELSLEFVHSF